VAVDWFGESHGDAAVVGFFFIPRALAFERAKPGDFNETTARAWTRLSLLRLPLDVITCVSMLMAFATAAEW
jgi:hypothetical protein